MFYDINQIITVSSITLIVDSTAYAKYHDCMPVCLFVCCFASQSVLFQSYVWWHIGAWAGRLRRLLLPKITKSSQPKSDIDQKLNRGRFLVIWHDTSMWSIIIVGQKVTDLLHGKNKNFIICNIPSLTFWPKKSILVLFRLYNNVCKRYHHCYVKI